MDPITLPNLILMLSLAFLTGMALGWKIGMLQRVASSMISGVN